MMLMKREIESPLEYRHNPLVVTATTEMNLAPSGFNTFIDYSRFIKNKNKIKIKKKMFRAYAEVPECETEVWAICTAPLLGTRK